jgi:murein DD-endopeptidase MepM/ murein hydrolase activator NlpD
MYRVLFMATIASCAVTPKNVVDPSAGAIAPAHVATTADVPGPFALVLSRLATSFELPVPHNLVDHFVQWQLGMRDLLHSATEQLAALAEKVPSVIPDLTILRVQPIADTLSSGYGWRDDPIRHTWKFHGGTDFPSEPGTPVDVAGDGIVTFAGRQGGYGNVVYVDHGGGVVTLYGHMRRIETKVGATVTAGERIGQVGQTGRATGPHLHFEVRLDNRPVDPVLAMQVADLERGSPSLGHLASFALAPEVQKHARAFSDRNQSRPERKGRGKRAQVNW